MQIIAVIIFASACVVSSEKPVNLFELQREILEIESVNVALNNVSITLNCNESTSFKELLKKLCVAEIQSGHITEALEHFSLLEYRELILDSIISNAYDKKPENVENILKFVDGLITDPEQEIGYSALFNEMESNNQMDNYQILMLAGKVKKIMDSKRASLLPEDVKKSYEEMKERFPLAARKIIWETVCLKSAYFAGEILTVTTDDITHDPNSRYVITWGGNATLENYADQWIFEPDNEARYFAIKNKLYDEYMYPSSNEVAYDHSRRRIFTWIDTVPLEPKPEWEIRLIRNGNGIYIRNRENLEHIYPVMHNGDLLDKDRRFVFSWRVVNRNPEATTQYDWLITECDPLLL